MIYLFTILYVEYDSTEHYFYSHIDKDIYYVDISHIDDSKIYQRYDSTGFDEYSTFEYMLPQILCEYDSKELIESEYESVDTCINKHIDKIIFNNI